MLVVEDDVKMAALLRRGLVEEGYAADVAATGDDAIRSRPDDRHVRALSVHRPRTPLRAPLSRVADLCGQYI